MTTVATDVTYSVALIHPEMPGDPDMFQEDGFTSLEDAIESAILLADDESRELATIQEAWCVHSGECEGGHRYVEVMEHWTDEDDFECSEGVEQFPTYCPVCDPPTEDEHERVLFLRHPEDGEVFAQLIDDVEYRPWSGELCTVYARVGQHSDAHPDYLRECDVVTDPEEYGELKAIIEGIYPIHVITEDN